MSLSSNVWETLAIDAHWRRAIAALDENSKSKSLATTKGAKNKITIDTSQVSRKVLARKALSRKSIE